METIKIVKPKKPQLWQRLHYYRKFGGSLTRVAKYAEKSGCLLGFLVSLVKESLRNRPKR